MVQDEPRKGDFIISNETVIIHIDIFTKRYTGEKLKLDYDPKLGFKLISPNEILAYNLKIERT